MYSIGYREQQSGVCIMEYFTLLVSGRKKCLSISEQKNVLVLGRAKKTRNTGSVGKMPLHQSFQRKKTCPSICGREKCPVSETSVNQITRCQRNLSFSALVPSTGHTTQISDSILYFFKDRLLFSQPFVQHFTTQRRI